MAQVPINRKNGKQYFTQNPYDCFMSRLLIIPGVVLTILTLTSCSGTSSLSSPSQNVSSGGPSADDANNLSNGIWEGIIYNTKYADAVGVTCNIPSDSVPEKGWPETCTFIFSVRNVSNTPQSLQGRFYVKADGKVYENSRTKDNFMSYLTDTLDDGYFDSRSYNPGEEQALAVNFTIPYLSTVDGLFIADSPSGSHLVDVPFSVQISK
jgi:hypothetical protein